MSLILSLDVQDLDVANELVAKVSPYVSHIKIGHIAASNFDVEKLQNESKAVMLDLKFFDILSTVREAITGYQRKVPKLEYFTVAAACQDAVIEMSLEHRAKPFFVLHLSSDTITTHASEEALRGAERIMKLGGVNFICPPFLISKFRECFGDDVVLATPGVRDGYIANDHSSTVTPGEAKRLGASFIIVGRPIVDDVDPTQKAREYYDKFVSV